MEELTRQNHDFFAKNGFLLVKNVLSENEIAGLRDGVYRFLEKSRKIGNISEGYGGRVKFISGDPIAEAGLGWLVFDPRIIAVAKCVLGQSLVYFGDTAVHIGRGSRGFHRDYIYRQDPASLDWRKEGEVIRMAVYLQNHSRHSGGPKVKVASHLPENFVDLRTDGREDNDAAGGPGRLYNIPVKTGDVALWTLRTTHSANNIRLKLLPDICLNPRLEVKIPDWLKLPEEKERIAIFITFAAPTVHTDRYIAYSVQRGDLQKHWRNSPYTPELVQKAKENNIEFQKPIPDYGSSCS